MRSIACSRGEVGENPGQRRSEMRLAAATLWIVKNFPTFQKQDETVGRDEW